MIDGDAITSHPAVIIAGVILVILVGAAVAAPRILGPVSQAISEFASSRRVAAVERDDADVADLKRQLSHVTARLDRMDRREARWRTELQRHVTWDTHAVTVASTHGVDLLPVPPLMSPDPDLTQETS